MKLDKYKIWQFEKKIQLQIKLVYFIKLNSSPNKIQQENWVTYKNRREKLCDKQKKERKTRLHIEQWQENGATCNPKFKKTG